MLNRIVNWVLKKLNKPVRFDFAKALEEAQAAAEAELAALDDPEVLAEVERWEHEPDPLTDGVGCECEGKH